jgi:hypothetical protein
MEPLTDVIDISSSVPRDDLRLRAWSMEEFAASGEAWSNLLGRSTANPLFMSWEWQWNWWRHHAEPLRGELLILAAYDSVSRLVGIAPLYLHRGSHRGLSAGRVESLGSSWRGDVGVFSEYLDLIADGAYEDAFIAAVAGYLLDDPRWSDFVFANTRVDGLAARLMQRHFSATQYVRSADPLVAYTAQLPGSFDQYVRSLNRATRRRVWNHRKKVQGAELHCVAGEDVPRAFDQLNRFHAVRWGNAHYLGLYRAFHQWFADAMSRRYALRMSELRWGSQALSIMYNVRIGATEYNVQSGFDPTAGRGISPGYLHFGYCIERACAEGVRDFDFLAGPGRHREYKTDFCTEKTRMMTLQSIRSHWLAWLYRKYDKRQTTAAIVPPS